MIRQDFVQREHGGESAALMALWQQTGGAVEALAAGEAARAKSRPSGDLGDDGLQAGPTITTHFRGCIAVDGGLKAGYFTTHPFSCAEDGFQAGAFTSPYICDRIDDGLEAANVTKGYGCIPPSTDEGLAAGNASYYGCGI